ncbi:Ubiquitin--protein ligase [Bertholletia excelsa]
MTKSDDAISSAEVQQQGESDGQSELVIPIHTVEGSSNTAEDTPHVKHWRKQNLFLEIPSRKLDVSAQDFVQIKMPATATSTPKKVNFLLNPSPSDAKMNCSPGPSSGSRGKSSLKKNLLPKMSFNSRSYQSDAVEASSSPATQEKSSIPRSWSLTKIFTPRVKRTSSLPVTPIGHSNSESTGGETPSSSVHSDTKESQRSIARSLSVPIINKERGLKRSDSFFRVIPSTPRQKEGDAIVSNATSVGDAENDKDNGEDISEEEAVCRICLVELCEGGETLKLECSCKGELALAHKECAVKWFSIKGNKTCDVCKQEVENLPVTLLRIRSVRIRNAGAIRSVDMEINGYRVWQEVPILVIISMLAYFCFLEQLLVGKMGTGAIAISLPFSCILGLLASMTSSTMVKKRFVWIYASVQFVLVVLFAHIFYSMIRVGAVLSIILSTFAGFGISMSGSSILVEFLRWRRRWLASLDHSAGSSHSRRRPPRQTEVENPETFSGS